MTTVELPKEWRDAMDAEGRGPRVVDPRTKMEYLLIPYPDAQAFLDFLDSKDPEQIAWRQYAMRTLSKRLAEDE